MVIGSFEILDFDLGYPVFEIFAPCKTNSLFFLFLLVVVYRGTSDTGSDGEHPPRLHGSLDDIPRPSSRRRKILTNGAISPRQCLSPQPCLPRSPASGVTARSSSSLSGRCLPSIPEVVNSGRMPLSGLVPAQSSHRIRALQQG